MSALVVLISRGETGYILSIYGLNQDKGRDISRRGNLGSAEVWGDIKNNPIYIHYIYLWEGCIYVLYIVIRCGCQCASVKAFSFFAFSPKITLELCPLRNIAII